MLLLNEVGSGISSEPCGIGILQIIEQEFAHFVHLQILNNLYFTFFDLFCHSV